jgi:hypothetical protein
MKAIRHVVWLLAVVGVLGFSLSGRTCPFCDGEKGPTLVGQFDEAQIVLFGHFDNARLTNNGVDQGESDFEIERVLKSHDMIKGKTKLTLPRYVTDAKSKFIIFCDVYKGKIDAYKGTPVAHDGEMIRYIEGIMKVKGKSPSERLRMSFDYLNSPEIEVAMDAYREYAKADYRDYKDMAKKLPADTIAGWLQDPKTPSFRYGLYASLLGHCGTKEHAKLLLSMIEDPEKAKGSGLHGLMAAYVMLEPEKGWAYLKDLVQAKDKPFLTRYSGLQTMRFLWENRPDLINAKDDALGKTEIVKGIAGVLKITDMADFAIEDLRKWHRWEYTDEVLGLYGKKNFNTPIIRKSILRYALQCPSSKAMEFVKTQRARDAEWVDETRELLDLETAPSAPPAPVPATKK